VTIFALPEPDTAEHAYRQSPTAGTDRLLKLAAAYAAEYGLDAGGHHLRTLLLALVVADQNPGVTVDRAIDLAAYDAFDPRVTSAAVTADELLDKAEAAEVAR
jgi:hypothetical protein